MNGFSPSISTFAAMLRACAIALPKLHGQIVVRAPKFLILLNFFCQYDGRDIVVTKVDSLPFNLFKLSFLNISTFAVMLRARAVAPIKKFTQPRFV